MKKILCLVWWQRNAGGAAVRACARTNDRRTAPRVYQLWDVLQAAIQTELKITLNEVGREGGSLVDNLHLEKRDFQSLKSLFSPVISVVY